MNPLTAHLERYQKQPPLIKEEEDAGVKKRSFSSCILFVLLAVFVFFLACLAVYTAVMMGIPVEKNEAASLKSDLPSSKVEVLQDSMIDKSPPKEPSKNVTNKTGNSSVLISNPSRLRIQIFIKGKDSEESKEHSDSDQNKTEETIFNSIPKSGIFLRRIIIQNNGLNKPEIDSSEEISSGSDESIKDVLGFKPFGMANAPNPLELFFNLLKLTEAPIDKFLNILEKQKSNESNTSAIEFPEKSAKNDKEVTPKDQIEVLPSVEKQTNEPKSDQPEQNHQSSQEKPNETKFEKQEISSIENKQLNPLNLINDAQRIISTIEQKRSNENVTPNIPHTIRTPVIRFFRFISPDHSQIERQETYSPMYQRTFYQHPNQYSHSMTRLPYSPENMPNKGSFNAEDDKMNDVKYKIQTTMTPSTIHQTQTTTPPEVYSTTPSGYSNSYREHFGETTNHHHKDAQNQMKSISNKQEQAGMIDRINTENIEPFEKFFKYRNL